MKHIYRLSDADFRTYLDVWGNKSFLIDEAISSLTSAISRKARGGHSPVQSLLLETLKADLPKRVEEIQQSISSDREHVIDQGCEALDGIFFALSVECQCALIQGWLSALNDSKISLQSHGALMALGIAYRHIWRQNRTLGSAIRDALLSQTEGKDYVTEVWALRSLASSVLIEEGMRFEIIMCSRDTHDLRFTTYDYQCSP